MKIGVFQFTSERYSGGRVYLWQYCWAAAMLGHDVTLVTNRAPIWSRDLPPPPNLHICEDDGSFYKFDAIVTDAKCVQGQRALACKQKHPGTLFFIVSFETSNWVQKYDPVYAAKDSTDVRIVKQGDYFISISEIGRQHFVSWLGLADSQNTFVLPPAVNDVALKTPSAHALPTNRRYMVWSGHAFGYKGWSAVNKALAAIPIAFDLIVFGELGGKVRSTPLHRIISYAGRTEAEKYFIFKNAHMCVAPSLFEGYGMVPGEALSSGIQCIAYDLPVLREAYGQPLGLHYCAWNDVNEFVEMTRQVALAKKPKLATDVLPGHTLADMINRIAKLPHHGV